MDRVRRVNDLLSEAAELAIGPAQVSRIEEAVRVADSIGDDELRFGTRLELVTAATFAGMPERSLVAFAWLLGKADADPERFDVEQLLFPYRWIVEDVPYLLSVSAERVDALIDDMAMRYDRHWWWEHPVWEARMRWAMVRGAPTAEVAEYYRAWRREFARSGNTSSGHEVHTRVIALCYLQRWDDAIAEAAPIVDAELPPEEEYPARTFAVLLEPARRARHPRRPIWRSRATDLCAGNQVFIREVAMVVEDYLQSGEVVPGRLLENLRDWVDSSRDDHGIMFASATLARALQETTSDHRRRALDLASEFDERHSNSFVSDHVRRRLGSE